MKKTVNEGQNIFDVALQHLGDIEATFSLLEANNFDLNTKLSGGLQVEILDSDIVNKIIVNEFQKGGAFSGEETEDLFPHGWLFDVDANSYVLTDEGDKIIIV